MPANWRVDCSATGGGATAGDGGAISVTVQPPDGTQDDVIFNEPGRRSRCRAGRRREPICRGFTRQRDTAMGGITDNISCVPIRASKADTQPRNEVRSVVSAGPSCQRRRKASNHSPGRLDSFPGAVAPAPAKISDSALMERSGKAGRQWGDRAAESSLARSPAARCQTNLVLPVRPASFAEWGALERSPTEWKISERSESWPVSRLMRRPARTKSRGLMLVSSATGGASRRNADALPVRSIAG